MVVVAVVADGGYDDIGVVAVVGSGDVVGVVVDVVVVVDVEGVGVGVCVWCW